jgi:excisionase family DNA binding protein
MPAPQSLPPDDVLLARAQKERPELEVATSTVQAAEAREKLAGASGVPDLTPLVTVREVAQRLQVRPVTVYRLCERGELAHLRVSNAIRILPEDLDASRQRTADEAQQGDRNCRGA